MASRTLAAAVEIRRPLPIVFEHFVRLVLGDLDEVSPEEIDRVVESLQDWSTASYDAGHGQFTFVHDERIEFVSTDLKDPRTIAHTFRQEDDHTRVEIHAALAVRGFKALVMTIMRPIFSRALRDDLLAERHALEEDSPGG
jgi:hypothetical protein